MFKHVDLFVATMYAWDKTTNKANNNSTFIQSDSQFGCCVLNVHCIWINGGRKCQMIHLTDQTIQFLRPSTTEMFLKNAKHREIVIVPN